MDKIKKYIISLSVMIAATIVSLLIVSSLTYMFKWQADKAMVGIIITYVLAGFAGGFFLRRERKIIGALGLGTIFMFFLILCSCIGFQISFTFSKRFLLIWFLLISSVFAGMCVKG